METILQLCLKILNQIAEMFNRETSSDEKIKDDSVKSTRDLKKAIKTARLIFDGTNKFQGLDVLAKEKFSAEEYKEYFKLKKKFNRYC